MAGGRVTEYGTVADCLRFFKVSRRTFDSVTRRLPGFPEPKRLGPRTLRWDMREIQRWADSL